MEKRSYRLDELAKDWDVSPKTVKREIKRGELQAVKVGSTWRVKDEDRRAYEKRQRMK